jgi:hypothetical protein
MIDVDVRGKDVLQQSFLGVAFHRKDDQTYESVYLRPFNFQATDPARHNHAIQYMQVPEFDWPILRQKFPEEFERPVDASIRPADWVHLKVVVKGGRIQAFVGSVATPTLDVRKLGPLGSGMVGLWVGNNSDGDFANLGIRGAAPLGLPPHALSRAASPARSVRVTHSLRSFVSLSSTDLADSR